MYSSIHLDRLSQVEESGSFAEFVDPVAVTCTVFSSNGEVRTYWSTVSLMRVGRQGGWGDTPQSPVVWDSENDDRSPIRSSVLSQLAAVDNFAKTLTIQGFLSYGYDQLDWFFSGSCLVHQTPFSLQLDLEPIRPPYLHSLFA
ncbi:hypothetical protein BATDEDRAFT_89869 [Batrachochytrium dendrobatidis JAM81]|uniref:Uncharacterized protein n=2 Tax=Batrachochytrium dendrobatidis TaxID=109871 RepID=F4P5H2_BATDJ|nr:uncharacterized protein BATDEDRAFT_89869 [Batrachochytrium dendrobatidis JAM81]EGF79189.1 hypothetical protein BATDEDRAFT_89869 [Batrachochytrium dendrobatidis JAM81]|eukprot:XP_006680048.1 hypothetical protein BATDEDRAFT_89869 [Batrachochytrium dendrobatidis JAM81]